MSFRLSKLVRFSLAISVALILMITFNARVTAQMSVYFAPVDYSLLNPALMQNPPAQLRLPALIASTTPLPVGQYYGTGGITYNLRRELSGYSIAIQADPQNCRQALVCTEAYLEATAIDGASPSIQAQYSLFYNPMEMARFRATAGHGPFMQQLSSGQTVTILPWTEAGAGIGYEKAIWDECDAQNICYRYVVGLRGGDPSALIAMLESISFGGNTQRTNSGGVGGFVSGDWNQLVQPVDPKR